MDWTTFRETKFKPALEFNQSLHEAMRCKPVGTRNPFVGIQETERSVLGPLAPAIQETQRSVLAPLATAASKHKIPRPVTRISPAVVQHDATLASATSRGSMITRLISLRAKL